jgi:hypothetical protein
MAFLTLLLWTTGLFAQPTGTVYLFGSGSDGVMNEFSILGERAEKLPQWTPNDGPPPLPIGSAIKAAEAWMKVRNPEIKQFEVATIALAKMTYPRSLVDRWYYRIEFNPIVGGQTLHGGQFTAVVLFDNTVVEPRVRKQVEVR